MDFTRNLARMWRVCAGVALAFALVMGWTAIAQDTASPAAVDVRLHDQLGETLVDAAGMTLYAFVDTATDRGPDRVTQGMRDASPTCTDGCAEAWPPFLTDGAPEAAASVDPELLYTTERADGTMQVTYNGWPLYFFVSDQAPGDTAGQGIAPPAGNAFGATWYMLAPDGSLITEQPTADPGAGDGVGDGAGDGAGDGGGDGDDDGGGGGYY